MRILLLLTLCTVSCGRDPGPLPRAVIKPLRPRIQSGLFLTCSHVVVNPGLIIGVLTVRNVGTETLALVDRWNSWGAYQWWLSVGAQSAGNPQHSWYMNFYTESALAPGDVRHARFQVTRIRKHGPVREGAWWFLAGGFIGSTGWHDESIRGFAHGEPVTLALNGALAQNGEPDPMPATGLWTGNASVRSTEVRSPDELKEMAQGMSLQ